ncbi:hypothetical protein H2248_011062 [Termitomyces sp. 'cryptogamus']|nr:hypothetical protein H2248_011062 [Termitomyces sp. 'cryptogamus']
MLDLLHTSGPTTFGTVSSGRNYDYTKIYGPDKPGEEAKENARIWNIYLDEAESYDADMIQGFRNIMDGLLVFAALFSAVVTTFVAQTSQTLQPDSAQITAYLLYENNQLLRAAGNRTIISDVPAAPLAPGSRTHTTIDICVNGLFFTSLALSLSTALLTVLAKQWIHAYTSIVPGGARTRALIRHFRFRGLTKWKLSEIIESLPMILHSSVAIFLVGLALYVSQLSSPICGVISAITAITFLFYFGTSVLPAFDIACPYRITFMFSLTEALFFAFRVIRCTFLRFWRPLDAQCWPHKPRKSLKMEEHNKVLDSFPTNTTILTWISLVWVADHSSNHSVKEAVCEGACGLLDEWSQHSYGTNIFHAALSTSEYVQLLEDVIIHSLLQLPDMMSTCATEDEIEKSIYGRLIVNFLKLSSSKSLLNIVNLEYWQNQIEMHLVKAYEKALMSKCHALSRCLLNWVGPDLALLSSLTAEFHSLLLTCALYGDAEDIHDLVARGIDLSWRANHNSWTALHWAASKGNLNAVTALVEQVPALVFVQANYPDFIGCTALDLAVRNGNSDVVAYLLDHGAHPNVLHVATHPLYWDFCCSHFHKFLAVIEVLLDHGWDRTTKDTYGRTFIGIAHSKQAHNLKTLVEHLENYQTVRLRPYGYLTSPTPNERAT